VPVPEFDRAAFVAYVHRYCEGIAVGERRIVAIAGPPASGKSTIASELHERLNGAFAGSCALLPMDGFHYDDEVLAARGWLPRKGARRLRDNEEETVAVPRFDRSIEIARAGAILIERSVRLIVTEGNYLLLVDDPWPGLRPSFDRTTLIVSDLETLEARNRQRWVDMDKDEDFITAKLELNDMPNVRLVMERSADPDWVIRT
jgi:pantothenate kinase